MKGSLLGASLISVLSLGCTRVQSFSVESVDYVGRGEFLAVVSRHVNAHYKLLPHERIEEVEFQYELYSVRFNKDARRYDAEFLAPFGGMEERSLPVVYSMNKGLELSPFSGDKRSCEHNGIYGNWSRVQWSGRLATLCDGVLKVEERGLPACDVDLRKLFFRDPEFFAQHAAQRYPLRIQVSGGRLFAYVAFDSTGDEEFYGATLERLNGPVNALYLIEGDCATAQMVNGALPANTFVRSLGVESPTAMLLEDAKAQRFYISREGRVLPLSGAASQEARFTFQSELDTLFLDDLNGNIVEVRSGADALEFAVIASF